MLRDTTPIIENTTMQIYSNDTGDVAYRITPISGYVLHDNARDDYEIDEATGDFVLDENGELIVLQGFTRGTASCSIRYDFEANEREFFTRLESEVPADRIFGVGNNEHEVM